MENNSNNKKSSPNKFWQALLANPAMAGAAISGVGGVLQGLMGRRGRRRRQREAQAEYDKMRTQYEGLDTSNIYADVQNPYTNMKMRPLTNSKLNLKLNKERSKEQIY